MDTKNTKEVLVAVQELTLEIIKLVKDGVQPADAVQFWNDMIVNEDMKAKFIAAANEISLVPAEVKDLDVNESVELAVMGALFVPKVLEALKK